MYLVLFIGHLLSQVLQVHINDNFAKFSEALFVADRHAREEVRQRALMQQKLAEKEKAAKEENLRMLAQRAREERAGISTVRAETKPSAERAAAMQSSLGAYGSDSGSESEGDEEDEEEGEAEEAEAYVPSAGTSKKGCASGGAGEESWTRRRWQIPNPTPLLRYSQRQKSKSKSKNVEFSELLPTKS